MRGTVTVSDVIASHAGKLLVDEGERELMERAIMDDLERAFRTLRYNKRGHRK